MFKEHLQRLEEQVKSSQEKGENLAISGSVLASFAFFQFLPHQSLFSTSVF